MERARSKLDSAKEDEARAKATVDEADRRTQAVLDRVSRVLEGTHATPQAATAHREIEAAKQAEQQAAARFVLLHRGLSAM